MVGRGTAVIPQYTWAGDHTIEAIEAGVTAVVDSDSDDYFVIGPFIPHFGFYLSRR